MLPKRMYYQIEIIPHERVELSSLINPIKNSTLYGVDDSNKEKIKDTQWRWLLMQSLHLSVYHHHLS